MLEAGKEEKLLAEERGSFHEGVPAITVIVDGGWSKRSHKHSYNANSGAAIIYWERKQESFYTLVCKTSFVQLVLWRYPRTSTNASEIGMLHLPRWKQISLCIRGFTEAEKVHSVRYTTFIGDGDSSVHPTLIRQVPVWGHAIKKLECANHSCKCYWGALEKLIHDNPSYKGKGGLTEKMRRRLVIECSSMRNQNA